MAAPMAPVRTQAHTDRRTIVERRNYRELKWNTTYHQYYNRNLKEETFKYLSDKIKWKPKKQATNWKFYQYHNHKIKGIPPLRGHTLSDIGDSFITIGDRKKKAVVDIYQFTKDLSKKKKIIADGRSPCCRFHHSAEYIPPLNQILFFGGFDSKCNYNDARLFSLNNSAWYDLVYDADIDFRAFHSSASRLITTKGANGRAMHKWECYIFGGQCCVGGPYQYHNDIFKFTFYDNNYIEAEEKEDVEAETLGYFACDQLQINGDYAPRARSQSHSFIKDNVLYIFGGSCAISTFNDLWALDLNTNIWTQIEYKGILKAPMDKTLKPKDYRVVNSRTPCYYDEKLNQLIVIHFGGLSDIQREFMKCEDSLSEFEQRMNDKKNDNDDDNGLKKGAIGLMHDGMKCKIFVFDLREQRWFMERSRNVSDKEIKQVPTIEIGTTRIIRIGEYILFFGGGNRQNPINYVKKIHLLKVPNYRVINTMSWSRERLLWIGHYKFNDEKNKQNVSIFNQCAKDIICLIISFLNPRPVTK